MECYCGVEAGNKLVGDLERISSAKCSGKKDTILSGVGGAEAGGLATQVLKSKLG